MKNTHHFTVTVKTDKTKQSAEHAILNAFAGRSPDACEFYLSPFKPQMAIAGEIRELRARLNREIAKVIKIRKAIGKLSGIAHGV